MVGDCSPRPRGVRLWVQAGPASLPICPAGLRSAESQDTRGVFLGTSPGVKPAKAKRRERQPWAVVMGAKEREALCLMLDAGSLRSPTFPSLVMPRGCVGDTVPAGGSKHYSSVLL